jgi:hypothetical protein
MPAGSASNELRYDEPTLAAGVLLGDHHPVYGLRGERWLSGSAIDPARTRNHDHLYCIVGRTGFEHARNRVLDHAPTLLIGDPKDQNKGSVTGGGGDRDGRARDGVRRSGGQEVRRHRVGRESISPPEERIVAVVLAPGL